MFRGMGRMYQERRDSIARLLSPAMMLPVARRMNGGRTLSGMSVSVQGEAAGAAAQSCRKAAV